MITVLWKGAQPGTWSMGATKSARAWDRPGFLGEVPSELHLGKQSRLKVWPSWICK